MSRLRVVFPFVTLLVFSSAAIAAIPGWYPQSNPGAPTLSDIFALDANTAFAVGGGTIIKTTDGGQTWTKVSTSPGVALQSVYFLDANHGWAAGNYTVVTTSDGGNTWTSTSVSDFTTSIEAISFPTASIGVAVGKIGSQGFLRTTDGGQNWTQLDVQNSGSNRPQDLFFLNAQLGWAVGMNADQITTTCDLFGGCYTSYTNPKSRIWRTTDGGATWTTVNPTGSGWLLGVSFFDSMNGWVVGRGGRVLKTIDGGVTWSSRTSGTTSDLQAVDFVDVSTGWAVAANGVILHTTDGGETWTAQQSGTTSSLNGVDLANATSGWAVGGMNLLRTDNGGVCTTVSSPTSASVAAAGGEGTLTVTSAAGCAWTVFSNTPWISITSGNNGSGTGSVTYVVAANTAASRQGSIEIAGRTFIVVQIGAADELTFRVLAGAPPGATSGTADGMGSAARFNYPRGVAVDTSGNVYVADALNNAIRKVSPSGEVTTLAGLAGNSGSGDGTGSGARFNTPSGVAVDAGGNVYVADSGNYTIRKVTPDGVVTTLAGLAGTSGSADGTGSAARFFFPRGVAVDAAGSVVCIADADNNTIRKLTPLGDVTTLAGLAGSTGAVDGTGSAARFNSPRGVAVDSSGDFYVADTGNHTIRKVTPAGVVTTVAGLAGSWGTADGTGSGARFNSPGVVAVGGAGNLYVADSDNNTVRKVTAAGVVTTIAGTAGSRGSVDGTGSAARFNYPRGIAVDLSGNIYVGDSNNNTIRKITPEGIVTTLAGPANIFAADGTGAAARFNNPSGVAVDSSKVTYVADSNNSTIRKVTPAGVVTTFAGLAENTGSANGTGSAARFNAPQGVAVDGSGNILVADTYNHTIRMITPAGAVTTLAGSPGVSGTADGTGSAARFNLPSGVAAGGNGNVYVADTWNHTIRMITSGGAVTTLAGTAGVSNTDDGNGSAARFNMPFGLTVDAAGNVYVADSYNHAIRKIAPNGAVTTFVGMAGVLGSADGTGSAARFYFPRGVAADGNGKLYVADTTNETIRLVSPEGLVVTAAGLHGQWGFVDGTGSAARFQTPSGVAVDSGGNVYVSDAGNDAIRATGGLPGDVNGDGTVAVADIFYLINTLFANGPAPIGSGDANGDGNVSVADIFYLINYLFANGPAPK